MQQMVLLCGLGRLGFNLVGYLRAAGLAVVVIDQKPKPPDARLDGVTFLQGDIRDPAILEQAGLARVRGVIVATSDDLANIAAALQIRSMNAEVRIVIRMFNQNLLARLGKTVHNVFALSVSALTAPMFALIVLTGEALGTIASGEERYQIAEVAVASDSVWIGRPLSSIHPEHGCQVIGFQRGEACLLLHQVPTSETPQPGDRLTLCGEPAQLAPFLRRK